MTFGSFIVRKKEKKLTKSKAATFQRTSSPLAGDKFRGKELWGVTGERLLFWCYTYRSKGQSTASARLPIWTQTPLPIVWSKGKTRTNYTWCGLWERKNLNWLGTVDKANPYRTSRSYRGYLPARKQYVHLKVTTSRAKPAENHQIVLPLVKKKP